MFFYGKGGGGAFFQNTCVDSCVVSREMRKQTEGEVGEGFRVLCFFGGIYYSHQI